MILPPFSVSALPRIVFGEGRIADLPALVAEFGKKVLIVTGERSFRSSVHWATLCAGLADAAIHWESMTIDDEPSPQRVDAAVRKWRGQGIGVVVAIGGGSVLDAGKAIAALLPHGNSVLDHLEDVGRGLPYGGPPLPLIAVPTTAGTGSEATKNAVLSERGAGGYKKSFRHDSMVPKVALVDPNLLAGCPAPLIAAQGMDAFTQLLESYVSLRANPFSDALVWSGLVAFHSGFWDVFYGNDSEAARQGRSALGYAALLSGITLAQVGLGSVHGLAQPLGSLFPVPHGVACGTLVATATAANIQLLQQRVPDSPALEKYARVGCLLAGNTALTTEAALQALPDTLAQWTTRLELPRLSAYGVVEGDIAPIVAASRNNSMKTNPVGLSDEEIASIVRARL